MRHWRSTLINLYWRAKVSIDAWSMQLAYGEDTASKPGHRVRRLRRFILPLGGCVLILFFLMGAASLWHHGSGRDSIIVSVLARILWILYSIAQLAFLILIFIAAYDYVNNRKKSSEN